MLSRLPTGVCATALPDVNARTNSITALDRLLPTLIRNNIREIVTDGNRICVVYDFMTNTDAGAVRCVELLTVDDSKILKIELILDRVTFAPVNKALSERAAQRR